MAYNIVFFLLSYNDKVASFTFQFIHNILNLRLEVYEFFLRAWFCDVNDMWDTYKWLWRNPYHNQAYQKAHIFSLKKWIHRI